MLSAEAIADRVKSLAQEIAEASPGRSLHLLVVLRGAFVFAADLARELDRCGVEVTFDFCKVSSYGDGTEPGVPVVSLPDPEALRGREVMIVEDIVDTGLALDALLRAIGPWEPQSLRCAALLSKPARRRLPVEPDHLGFVVPDRFLVGYGLDHAGRHRQLPYIGILPDG